MRRSKLYKEVVEIIYDQFNWSNEKIEYDTEFVYHLNADESDLNELAVTIQEELGVNVYDKIQELKTVRDLIDCIEENLY